jgi:diaminohydroxyphosphoribosylaminopyrimidine deaminase/5-amino-6-(5-phosphoribosylamino)uracil reductase
VRIDPQRQPLRVVLDRRRRVRKTARVLAPPGEVLLLAGPARSRAKAGTVEALGAARIERIRTVRGHLDLARVMARLAELEINEVLVEAGPRFSGALLSAGLVDEWLLYVAPTLLGPHAKPLANFARLTQLRSAPAFDLLESARVGPDMRLRLRPRSPGKNRSQG